MMTKTLRIAVLLAVSAACSLATCHWMASWDVPAVALVSNGRVPAAGDDRDAESSRAEVAQAPPLRQSIGGGDLPQVADIESPGPDLGAPVVPQLAAGVPRGVLRGYKVMAVAADKFSAHVAEGKASARDRLKLAQCRAVMTMINQNRYWYIGPRALCPPLPPSSQAVAYFRTPLEDDNIAVFELLQAEFPGTYEPPPVVEAGAEASQRSAFEAARRAVQR